MKALVKIGGSLLDDIPPQGRWDLAVDGLFGIGLTRPLEGRFADLVRRINSLGVPVIALDIPSGINADTGAVMGVAVHATHTLSFIALKPGLLTLDARRARGELGWHDRLDFDAAVSWTVDWAKRVEAGESTRDVTVAQIEAFEGRNTR